MMDYGSEPPLPMDSRIGFKTAHCAIRPWWHRASALSNPWLAGLYLFLLLALSAPALSQTQSAGNYVIGPQDVLAIS